MKQAKHVVPHDGSAIQIVVCDMGGFLIGTKMGDPYMCGTQAAFTSADECADWVRSFLRNATAKKFGAQKQS